LARTPLPPDPKAEAEWQQLVQNVPSARATTPIGGAHRWLWGLLIAGGVIALLALIARGL
jgi:hypothetical protein